VRVSRALGFNTLIVMASFLIAAMSGSDACLNNTKVLLAETLSILTIFVGMAQASLVTDTVDSFAEVLGWILFVGALAKEVSGAISIGSAVSRFTIVVDADLLGTTLIVFVASNRVASVLHVFR